MQRLDAAKKRHQATKDRLTREEKLNYTLEQSNEDAQMQYKESETLMVEVERDIAH